MLYRVYLIFVAGLCLWVVGARPAESARLADLVFDPPLQLEPGEEFRVAGKYAGRNPGRLILRIEDSQSRSYRTRVNEELRALPGYFDFRISPAGLRTEAGRYLDAKKITRFMVFSDDSSAYEIEQVGRVPALALGGKAKGWDFGPEGSPVFPGFVGMLPGHKSLSGRKMVGIMRPSGDVLIQDGISGVGRFRVPLAKGKWKLTMWIDDPGEWEYVPYHRERRIRVNGRTILQSLLSPKEWIRQKYHALINREALMEGDAWDTFGKLSGGKLSTEVDITDGFLTIDLAGNRGSSGFLSAILVEPANTPIAADQIDRERAARFRTLWPTVPPFPDQVFGAKRDLITLSSRFDQSVDTSIVDTRLALSPGVPHFINHWLTVPGDRKEVLVEISAPANVLVKLRVAHWRFRRADGPNEKLLKAVADEFHSFDGPVAMKADIPRRLQLEILPAENAAAGPGAVLVTVRTELESFSKRIGYDILPIQLPVLDRSIGVFLARPPAYTWFPSVRKTLEKLVRCDLETLASLGLTSAAPAITPPYGGRQDPYQRDVGRARGILPGNLIDYVTLKSLNEGNPGKLASRLHKASSALLAAGEEPPVWTLADEPDKSRDTFKQHRDLAAAVRKADKDARLAAFLNSPDTVSWSRFLDISFLNPGVGLNAKQLKKVRSMGAEVMLYNMKSTRLAAGFYLWRVAAKGYLEWHGRMPTANPHDPTDGREDDFNMLPSTPKICPEIPAVTMRLTNLAEGVVDLRWLMWLESQSVTNNEASDLLRRIRGLVSDEWEEAKLLKIKDLIEIRGEIILLAQRLLSKEE